MPSQHLWDFSKPKYKLYFIINCLPYGGGIDNSTSKEVCVRQAAGRAIQVVTTAYRLKHSHMLCRPHLLG